MRWIAREAPGAGVNGDRAVQSDAREAMPEDVTMVPKWGIQYQCPVPVPQLTA